MIKQDNRIIRQEERPFDVSELFFSTTDRKGIITACNDVFLRVGAYPPEELLGKPHNTIRHPDMPRCVFYLLWEYLLSGRPIGAYVKNLAKTGEFYWVYALASPVEDGFISVRLKPTGPHFQVVKKLYPELLNIEKGYSNWKEGMAASKDELMKQLKALGFENYNEFMNATLRTEMLVRDDALAQRGNVEAESTIVESQTAKNTKLLKNIFRSLETLLALRSTLREKQTFFLTLGTHISRVAINASIRAAHLAENGRSLSVISEEVSNISKEIERDSGILRSRSHDLAQSLGEISFHIAQAILQSEAKEFFEAEQARQSTSSAEQVAKYGKTVPEIAQLLASCSGDSVKRSVNGIADLKTSLGAFEDISNSLEKILLSIQFSYVTGKTLTARIDSGESFSALLGDMISLSESARSEIISLRDSVGLIKKDITRWRVNQLAVSEPRAQESA